MSEAVQITLEDSPIGGIALVGDILDLLHDHVSSFQEEVERQTQNHRLELRRSLATVSETYYTLRSVMMGIPPWPVSSGAPECPCSPWRRTSC